MFREWLKENDMNSFTFSGKIFPKASDREFWDKYCDDECIKRGEQFVDFGWPVARATDFMAFKQEGNRMKHENVYFQRRDAFMSLVLAELCEYKGRFIPDIVNGIFAIGEETFWGLSAHFSAHYNLERLYNIPLKNNDYIDLFAADTGATMAITYYLFYDELKAFCPEILTFMEDDLERRMKKPYLNRTDMWWMGYHQGVNNWNPWILANLLTVFLFTEKDVDRVRTAVSKMIYEINKIYERIPNDGGCDEGASYWAVAGGMIFQFVDQLYLATEGKINFFTDKKLCEIFLYDYKVHIGGNSFVNYADGNPRVANLETIFYMVGRRLEHDGIKSLAAYLYSLRPEGPRKLFQSKIRNELYRLIFKNEISSLNVIQEHDHDSFLSDLQVTTVHRGKWFYSAKGGHNDEGHNHNDVGNFIVYYDVKPVLCDAGCGTYTRQTFGPERYTIWTMRTDWHNLPVINGQVQKVGPQYAASSFEFDNSVTTTRFEKAYTQEAHLVSLQRSVEYKDDAVIVVDSYEFDRDENVIEQFFVSPNKMEALDNSVRIDSGFELVCDSAATVSTDSVDFDGDKKLIDAWDTDSMKRAAFRFNVGRKFEVRYILRRV